MGVDLNDLSAFVAVVRAGGFRDGARVTGVSPSGISEAVRRLEAKLGVRLINRSTRSIAPTQAGARLLERPVLSRAAPSARAAARLRRFHQGPVR